MESFRIASHICEIRRDTAPYNSVINSVYTVDGVCIRTGSVTEFIYCVDRVYDGAVSLHISHMVLLCELFGQKEQVHYYDRGL